MERFVLLGVARARAPWFRTVGQWAAAGMLPVELVRCVSLDEVRARLAAGRPFSALLVDGSLSGLDRDLLGRAHAVGVAVLVVEDRPDRAWRDLGAAAVLAESFSRDELVEVLQATCVPISDARSAPPASPAAAIGARGRLVAVCGPGGTGASSVAIALAQGLTTTAPGRHRQRRRTAASRAGQRVVLADCCRVADQAMLHDSRVLVPGVQELVEAHRVGTPTPRQVLEQTFEVPGRGYHLLLGLRRPSHWASLPPAATARMVEGLRVAADVVVADVEADVEGEQEGGSRDVEDRNGLARAVLAAADQVVLVGVAGMKGLHALARTLGDLVAFGVDADRVVMVLNHASRAVAERGEVDRTLRALTTAVLGDGAQPAGPVWLPSRGVERALRDGVRIPAGAVDPLTAVVADRLRGCPAPEALTSEPVPVQIIPGSFRGFTAQEGTL